MSKGENMNVIPSRVKDEIGNRYGGLVVVGYEGLSAHKVAQWRCRCECGNESIAAGRDLRSGHTTSCGCQRIRGLRQAGYAAIGAYLTDEPDYRAAHLRVSRARGRAIEYDCVECGDVAAEWAYNHADPDELTGEWRGYVVTYSGKPEHYRPMCVPCHRRHDARRGRPSTGGGGMPHPLAGVGSGVTGAGVAAA